MSLREDLIKLGQTHPKFRPDLRSLLRQGADDDEGLDLRAKIRDRETAIGKIHLDAGLPSEDSIMDSPRKYNAKMKKALKTLDQIEKLTKEYNQMF